ncbi:hypothetical protein SODALDRAFT_335168 [Sodiomyces alkalinus F11]|uniref:Trafficking protein particle complex II-specific subunit 65 IgD3 domain-containing protein n=1 Tax=Sodiomyces alkalinus (strain CBS 110278 / VKM F-3762 / F11) TaxID=1314773 RepID=A0A3N2PR14_SODAK|nr:hypothetical protein SODALDRAFT_335168 [Sodiomyces alkalinus F11]ROT36951.1 hypothetical protein SODALDRAFT_335168 [Sodiomyces alkalinus F11]
MAIDDGASSDALGRGPFDIIESSHLSYIIPKATNLDLEEASQDADDTGNLFDAIEKRQELFFDETVDVHLILRAPLLDEATLRSYLTRLHISLEAQVVNGQSAGKDTPPASDTIFEGVVEDTDDPFIVVNAAEDSDDEDGEDHPQQQPHIYAVWKLSVFLARPRVRLQSPSVVFRASANLKPADATGSPFGGTNDGYMRSGVPAGLNLLESFNADPALGGVTPRLSALRVSRVAPVTQTRGLMKPLRAQPSLKLNIFPAIHTRVRFSRPNTIPPSPALIAMLEVDFTSHIEDAGIRIRLDKVTLTAQDTVVQDLNYHAGLSLPHKCAAHDHVTLLYRLAPAQAEMLTRSPTRNLDVSIEATMEDDSGICTPKLTLAWTTNLDFTLPVNPGFGSATQPPLQRAHRPSQLSISGSESLIAPAVSRPDALPALEAATARSTETTIPDLGLTMTICAPPGPLFPGEPFTWTIYVVNRAGVGKAAAGGGGGGGGGAAAAAAATATAAPPGRKLALLALPKRRRTDVRVVRPPSAAEKGKTAADRRKTADAVLDENVVHAMQRNSLVDAADVVCLSPDTRVGPLAPGACHVVDLKFVALRAGIVGMEAIRVVDLGTQEHVDVRELPIMVVDDLKAEEDGAED